MQTSKDTINIKGTLLNLSAPMVMGILNVTNDSFYDGGRFADVDAAVDQATKMLHSGAKIIDVGGASSRPGADTISEEEEVGRVVPVIEALKKKISDVIISIDTNKSVVAEKAVRAGADIVNDISSGDDDVNMLNTVGALGVPYMAMHKQGNPKTMQKNPTYDNVTLEVVQYFQHKIPKFNKAGIKDIIIDPGFGFGKTVEHNYELLRNLALIKDLIGLPILVGVSRKSMINKALNISANDALNGTTVLNSWALQNGASIIRVHDVAEASEIITLYKHYIGTNR